VTTLLEHLAHDRIARSTLVTIYAVGIVVGGALAAALLLAIS
jgi:hypothetical protein